MLDQVGRNWAETWPKLAKLGHMWPGSAQVGRIRATFAPKLGKRPVSRISRPGFDQVLGDLVWIWPEFGQIQSGPHSWSNFAPKLAPPELVSNFAEIDRTFSEIGPEVARHRTKTGPKAAPRPARVRPTIGQSWWNSAQNKPKSAKAAPILSMSAQTWSKKRPTSTQLWPTLAGIGSEPNLAALQPMVNLPPHATCCIDARVSVRSTN